MPGLVIGIETATVLGGVAAVDGDGRILGEITLAGRESHSERIIPAAWDLLEAIGAKREDLAAVAVSSGPGSFTGLRTGLAAAKGLAFARGVFLCGVPTLEVLAANAPPGSGAVCAVLGARRGEVYRALFCADGAICERRTPDELVPELEFLADLPVGCLVLGDPPPLAHARRTATPLRFAAAHLNHPRAAVVALAGHAALRSGRPSELATLLPGYLRATGADIPLVSSRQGLSCNDKGFRDRVH